MLDVTSEFSDAIKNTVRKIKGKVEITWTDPTIDSTAIAVVNEANRISWVYQTIDTIEKPSYKYMYINSGCILDGNYHPAPSTLPEAQIYQMGWWSSQASGAGGTFATPLVMSLSIAAGIIMQTIKIAGDNKYNEYPVDFVIKIYTGAGLTLYDTITVTGNTDVIYNYIYSELILDVRKIELTISKWSVVGAVAKILEFSYATIIKSENDILYMNLLEEKEIRDGSIPIGNISSNELDLSINNIMIEQGSTKIKDPYFPDNPLSMFAPFVQPNRKIKAWIGVELPDTSIEYMPLGTFWTGDWQVEEVSNDAKTVCRDRMEVFRKTTHKGSWLLENTTLYDTAIKLMDSIIVDCKMPDLVYNIDIDLRDFNLNFAFFPAQSYFQCIKDIAAACGGVAYMDRNDVLIIERGY